IAGSRKRRHGTAWATEITRFKRCRFGSSENDGRERLEGWRGWRGWKRASVLVGIEQVWTGHDDDERSKSVEHFDGAFLRGEDVWQTAIDVRAFVETAAPEHHTFLPNPGVHHLRRHGARPDDLAGAPVQFSGGRRASQDKPGAVHGRKQCPAL